MVATGNWRVSANCRNGDPDRLFVTGAKQREARSICRGCPVLMQCLSHALDERIEFGVWGGMTERERRAMLRGRPDVTCWESFLGDVAARRASAAQPVAVAARVTAPVTEPVGEPVGEPVTVSAAAPARQPVALPTPLVPAARSVPVGSTRRPERLSEAA